MEAPKSKGVKILPSKEKKEDKQSKEEINELILQKIKQMETVTNQKSQEESKQEEVYTEVDADIAKKIGEITSTYQSKDMEPGLKLTAIANFYRQSLKEALDDVPKIAKQSTLKWVIQKREKLIKDVLDQVCMVIQRLGVAIRDTNEKFQQIVESKEKMIKF